MLTNQHPNAFLVGQSNHIISSGFAFNEAWLMLLSNFMELDLCHLHKHSTEILTLYILLVLILKRFQPLNLISLWGLKLFFYEFYQWEHFRDWLRGQRFEEMSVYWKPAHLYILQWSFSGNRLNVCESRLVSASVTVKTENYTIYKGTCIWLSNKGEGYSSPCILIFWFSYPLVYSQEKHDHWSWAHFSFKIS